MKVGNIQTISLETGGALPSVAGKVTFISPVADPASGLVEVRITFMNALLAVKPGIKGSIEVPSFMPALTPAPALSVVAPKR